MKLILIISLSLNLILAIAAGYLLTHGSSPLSLGISGANVSNIRFYTVDSDLNIQYQDRFSSDASINMSFGFNVDPASPQTYHIIMTRDDTQVFNFEMPLTGAGDRKFALPRQGDKFNTGTYKVEIRDDQNRVIAANQFKVE